MRRSILISALILGAALTSVADLYHDILPHCRPVPECPPDPCIDPCGDILYAVSDDAPIIGPLLVGILDGDTLVGGTVAHPEMTVAEFNVIVGTMDQPDIFDTDYSFRMYESPLKELGTLYWDSTLVLMDGDCIKFVSFGPSAELVPEPAVLSLIGIGGFGMVMLRRITRNTPV